MSAASTYKKLAVQCSASTFVVEIPHLRQAAKTLCASLNAISP